MNMDMKKILLAAAVFLAAGGGAQFLIQKGDLLESQSPYAPAAAVYEIIAPASSGQKIVKHHGVYIYFVNYDNEGFHPRDFKMPVGNSARFVNNSDKAMRIYSKNQNTPYHFLNQSFSIKKGEFYTFNFTLKGRWEFYNLNNPKDYGSIEIY
jgi:hypothetical protein